MTEENSEISSEQLIQDIQLLGNVVQQHDQSIFQMIASLNAIQSVMLSKSICTEEEISEATQAEAKTLQEKIMNMVQEKEK